jgi:hypothetical protein
MTTADFLLAKATELGANLNSSPRIEIPNCGRDDLARWFCELGFTEGVEIGVKAGEYSEILCRANPNLHLYSVDPWLVRAEYYDTRGQKVFDSYEKKAREVLAPYNCTIMKAKSCDAEKVFDRASLDFVFIDGHHNLYNVIHDIHVWSTKVRPGGIISGHDYTRFKNQAMHVPQGVHAYVDAYHIDPWFILGLKNKVDGQIRDRHRSFVWVRPGYEANMRDYDPTFGGHAEIRG